MTNLFKSFLALLFISICCGSLFSQDTTSTKKSPILLAIEDSLRDKLRSKYDSAWMNDNLLLQQSILNIPDVYYKLVKIGKRNFAEGPNAKLLEEIDTSKYHETQYGDDKHSFTGEQVYTYVGNSSYGYYYEYHFMRVHLIKSSDLKFKFREPNTCEHGWDMRRGQACYQCLHEYKMEHDSSYKANDSIKKLKAQILDCAHGHICCETDFCYCCPEKNRTTKTVVFNKLPVIETPVCKHGYDANLGKACPQCMHEYRMSKDSTLKPYLDYFPKPDSLIIKTQIDDCAHSHLCCQIKCYCCPDGYPNGIRIEPQPILKKKRWWKLKKK